MLWEAFRALTVSRVLTVTVSRVLTVTVSRVLTVTAHRVQMCSGGGNEDEQLVLSIEHALEQKWSAKQLQPEEPSADDPTVPCCSAAVVCAAVVTAGVLGCWAGCVEVSVSGVGLARDDS